MRALVPPSGSFWRMGLETKGAWWRVGGSERSAGVRCTAPGRPTRARPLAAYVPRRGAGILGDVFCSGREPAPVSPASAALSSAHVCPLCPHCGAPGEGASPQALSTALGWSWSRLEVRQGSGRGLGEVGEEQ